MALNRNLIHNLARAALSEDSGSGDATTLAVVPEGLQVEGVIKSREKCVCAGLPLVHAVYSELDKDIYIEDAVAEGEMCAAGTVLARITGNARAMLTGERIVLNFLQRLSGIATLTRQYVEATGRHHTKILDTRKTTPGLRVLEKYAVKQGGGENHRFGLYDRIMIKDNHRLLANLEGPGGIRRAVEACREKYPALDVEVEADTLEDVAAALQAGADYIMLDNMDNEEMKSAVEMIEGNALIEASGGVILERIPEIAATGVDFISVGALTHSAPAIDIGLDINLG
ncbi:MAG: carboxylating nicotinate-nucleotide diphosphorylase [Lentisphaeria bacterium]